MKPQRRRKSNIQSIEVKVKQQPLQPTGNESLQSESLSQEVLKKFQEVGKTNV